MEYAVACILYSLKGVLETVNKNCIFSMTNSTIAKIV